MPIRAHGPCTGISDGKQLGQGGPCTGISDGKRGGAYKGAQYCAHAYGHTDPAQALVMACSYEKADPAQALVMVCS